MSRHKIIPAVFLILEKDGKILMLRRKNTGHQDGNYSLPAGHLNGNETLAEGLAREVREEIGVKIMKKDLKLIYVVSHKGDDDERVDFFFTTEKWSGSVKNNEPEKCDDLKWFDKYKLPKNTVGYVRLALSNVGKNCYSEFGW